MEKLDEFVLTEILRRLPSVKSVTRCKLVCPHWNSVISSSHFRTSFLEHHSTPKKPFAIIFTNQVRHGYPYTLFSNDSIFQFDYDCVISFLKSTLSVDLKVLATYNELLLCLRRDTYSSVDGDDAAARIMNFYIYNPLTKHHVALPPSPVRARNRTLDVVGFLCRGRSRSSFRVVYVLYCRDEITMHIFSSEENKWTSSALDGDAIICDHHALPWNGLLVWKTDRNRTVVFCNPYGPDDERIHSIATPPETQTQNASLEYVGLGVFQETLRLWHVRQGLFRVWDLKDYRRKEWSLKHEVRMHPDNRPIAFDPNDEDVVYSVFDTSLYCFNMRSNVKSRLKTSTHLSNVKQNFFKLVMAGFPTPVPTITQLCD